MIFKSAELIEKKLKKIKKELGSIKEILTLAIIAIGVNDASDVFIKNKEKFAKRLGIKLKLVQFSNHCDERTILEKIAKLNVDPKITGIILQLPVPKNFDKIRLLNAIASEKDVDALGAWNRGLLVMGYERIVSPTAMAVLEILHVNKIVIEGKRIVIIGDGDVSGKPLARLLLNRGATVTVCNQFSTNLTKIINENEILISAVGQKNFISASMIAKEQMILIDVGVSIIDGKIYGDLDFENLKDNALLITPTPGGVGPLTVFYLLENLIKCYKYCKVQGECCEK